MEKKKKRYRRKVKGGPSVNVEGHPAAENSFDVGDPPSTSRGAGTPESTTPRGTLQGISAESSPRAPVLSWQPIRSPGKSWPEIGGQKTPSSSTSDLSPKLHVPPFSQRQRGGDTATEDAYQEEEAAATAFDSIEHNGTGERVKEWGKDDYRDSATPTAEVEEEGRNIERSIFAQKAGIQQHALGVKKDNALVSQLQQLKEALTVERETSDLLRDQLSYLQGQIAERVALEVGMQAEIDRLNADFAQLQGLVDQRVEMEQCTAELKMTTGENVELRGLMNTQLEQMSKRIDNLAAENAALRGTVDSSHADVRKLTSEKALLEALVSTGREESEMIMKTLRICDAQHKELQNKNVAVEGEAARLRVQNVDLQIAVAKCEEREKVVEENCKQLTDKMTILGQELHRLQKKSPVEATTEERRTSDTATHSSKEWEGWSVRDPSAIAVAVAEELRLQKLAVAQTVEKLLGENDHLINKVNEQAKVISDLTLSLQTKSEGDEPRASTRDVSINEKRNHEPKHETLFTRESENGHGKQQLSSTIGEDLPEEVQELPIEEEDPKLAAGVNDLPKIVEASVTETSGEANNPHEESSERQTVLVDRILEIQEERPSAGVTVPSTNWLPDQKKPAVATGSKVIKAPFRFMSFVADYISGKDLIRN